VIIDDGSSPSLEIVDLGRVPSLEVKLISIKENRGVASARNIGLKNVTGEWTVLLDSDNLLTTSFLTDFLDIVSQPKKFDVIWMRSFSIENGILNNTKTEFGIIHKPYKYLKKFHGEFLPIISGKITKNLKYVEGIKGVGTEPIFWMQVFAKYNLYISKNIGQIYDDSSIDRLSSFVTRMSCSKGHLELNKRGLKEANRLIAPTKLFFIIRVAYYSALTKQGNKNHQLTFTELDKKIVQYFSIFILKKIFIFSFKLRLLKSK